ncbi:hypothetical protein Mx4_p17 [Myxococcus phage Mx4]|nr:hypothetical protein Mx4_p17 [Myxococcus phage Mx4]
MGARSPSLDVLEQVAVALSTSAAALLSAGDESADVAAPLLGFIRSRRLDADDVQRLEHVARAMFALQEVSRG